jgi:hypothetical protein
MMESPPDVLPDFRALGPRDCFDLPTPAVGEWKARKAGLVKD